MIKSFFGLVLALALVQGAQAGPTPTPAATVEIDYLLDYLGKSGCQFYRNGTWYDSGAAKAHLRYKYDALVKRGQVGTAEDFIEKAATQSSLSGLAYKVRCAGGPEVSSSQWLRDALARYRSGRAQAAQVGERHRAPGPGISRRA
jgi:hypothetical protein